MHRIVEKKKSWCQYNVGGIVSLVQYKDSLCCVCLQTGVHSHLQTCVGIQLLLHQAMLQTVSSASSSANPVHNACDGGGASSIP